jgi:hypothetical protein
MNTAQKFRLEKEAHPERFCKDPRCLWRVETFLGRRLCPKHRVPDHPVRQEETLMKHTSNCTCDICEEKRFKEEWGEPISIYTDRQAIEEGVLADITSLGLRFETFQLPYPINRMTSGLWNDFLPFYPAPDTEGVGGEHMDQEALARALRTMVSMAVGSNDNTGEVGDIYTLPGGNEGRIWLVRNEVGGLTLMNPSDY